MKATYYKGHNGNRAESNSETDANGMLWSITTSKGRNGVECTAMQGQDQGPGAVCYDLMNCKRMKLASAPGMATEKKIREVHEQGIAEFERLMKEQQATEPAPYVLGIGQVVYTEHQQGRQDDRVIVEVIRPGHFKCALMDGRGFKFDSMLTREGEKDGIGAYYQEGETVTAAQAAELRRVCNQAETAQHEAERTAKASAAEERARKIAEGAKILQAIPAGVTHCIVGELHKDESDMQTDYFSHSTEKVIYLAWSNSKRDDFKEMRTAAGKAEETKHLATPSAPRNGHEHPDEEHREKYSMGSGYYLKDGHSNASGWAVSKASAPSLEVLQIAAAEGRLYCNQATPEWYKAGQGATTPTEPAQAGTVQIIEYSAKAIAVIGDTKPIKDKLRSLGGRFNFRLTCGAGWIFPRTALERVTAALQATVPTADEVEASEPDETPQEEAPIVTPQVPAPWSQHGAAQQMEDTAAELVTMADNHRAKMEVKRGEIREEVAKTIEFFRETGTSAQELQQIRTRQGMTAHAETKQMFLF